MKRGLPFWILFFNFQCHLGNIFFVHVSIFCQTLLVRNLCSLFCSEMRWKSFIPSKHKVPIWLKFQKDFFTYNFYSILAFIKFHPPNGHCGCQSRHLSTDLFFTVIYIYSFTGRSNSGNNSSDREDNLYLLSSSRRMKTLRSWFHIKHWQQINISCHLKFYKREISSVIFYYQTTCIIIVMIIIKW